jgi:hypothetical protein
MLSLKNENKLLSHGFILAMFEKYIRYLENLNATTKPLQTYSTSI